MMSRSLLILISLLLWPALSSAQSTDVNKTAANATKTSAKPAKDPEAERLLKERRDNSQSLLISLAADAGRFNDQQLRARTQARIADVLWSADPDRARSLFRKAWESAEVVDQEGQRKMQEEIAQQRAKTGGSATVMAPPNIRGEVLRLAARHDRILGEEFLAKMRTETQQEAADATNRNRPNPLNTPEAISQRLSLARQLLDADVPRALQFADPALTDITREGVDFLSFLREKDSAAADQRYAALLARAEGDLGSDANTVSLLTSYLFTPHMYVTFNSSGRSSTQASRGNATPPDVAPALRAAFFRVAADILLRPLAPEGQDLTSAGPQGKYLMLKRLGPLFDQYPPKEVADAIHAQADALAQGVPEDMRQRDDDALRQGLRPSQSSEDRVKALLDRIDRAKTSEERDSLYLQLAQIYAGNGDVKARDFVDKIEDSEMRGKVRAYIDGTLMFYLIDKKDLDKILEFVKTGELTHMQKSWALSQAARLLAKTDRDRALSIIEEASAEAHRIEDSDPDRPRALIGIATLLLQLDRSKIWDATYEAIKAANAAEAFSGEDGVVRTTLIIKGTSSVRNSSAQDFNVAGLFGELAKDDYGRAIELARGFQREAPRANSTIAIARSILEDKPR